MEINRIVVYGRTNCPQCKMTCKVLEKEGIEYRYINIDENQPERLRLTLLGFQTVPVTRIVFENGEQDQYITGFRPNELKKLK